MCMKRMRVYINVRMCNIYVYTSGGVCMKRMHMCAKRMQAFIYFYETYACMYETYAYVYETYAYAYETYEFDRLSFLHILDLFVFHFHF
jgi:hypothetical protein